MEEDFFQFNDEVRQRSQMESDREFELRAQSIGLQAKRIAIEKGTAAANAWYQKQMISLARDKFEEDKRQFDLTFGENVRQFDVGATGYIDRNGRRMSSFPRERWQTEETEMINGRPTWDREQGEAEMSGYYTPRGQLSPDQRMRYQALAGLDPASMSEGDRRELAGLEDILTGAGGARQATFGRERWQDSALRDWSTLASSLKGPEDWVQYQRLTQGLANNAASMPGLNWVQGGQSGGTTNATPTTPVSLYSIFNDMGIGGGVTPVALPGQQQGAGAAAAPSSWAGAAAAGAGQQATAQQAQGGTGAAGQAFTPDQNQLLQTANEFAAAPQMAAPGWLEGLDPVMVSMLKGAAESQGHDWAATMARYNKSRWGGNENVMAA